MGKVKQIANNAKTFDEMTRQQKKHAYLRIKLNGRWAQVPAMKFLEISANSLPVGVRPDGTQVDHLANLKKVYMADDVDGVKEYIATITKDMNRIEKEDRKKARKEANKNKPLWQRILNV